MSGSQLWTNTRKVVVVIVAIWVLSAIIGSFGAFLPQTVEGPAQWYDNDLLRAFIHPAAWLTIGVGASALIAFFAVADRTTTLRAPIAAAITIVFFGLLLFPIWFTGNVDQRLVERLIWAWVTMIVFYFGSEAAVQGTRIVQQRKGVAGGMSEEAAARLAEVPGDAPGTINHI